MSLFKSDLEQLYGINPNCRILLNKFISKSSNKPCIALRLWSPLKFVDSSTSDNTLIPTKSCICLTEYHAHDLLKLLQEILEPKANLEEPREINNWKQPKNSIITWTGGEKVGSFK